MEIGTLKGRVTKYKKILKNTKDYRKAWINEVKPFIKDTLDTINNETKLGATITCQDNMENLGVVIFSLGKDYS